MVLRGEATHLLISPKRNVLRHDALGHVGTAINGQADDISDIMALPVFVCAETFDHFSGRALHI